jgi:3,8-divinyl chlorophyllide a/chlorophyllide a reductase subunit Z
MDEMDDEIGFTSEKSGGSSFWGSKKAKSEPTKIVEANPEAGQPRLDKKKEDLGVELEGVHGVGAPTQNAFKRTKKEGGKDTNDDLRKRIQTSAEAMFGNEGENAPNIPLDTPVSNGYWGAMWTFTSLADVEVVVDAPVGCYSLPATATINYTDALPELENLASSNITEIEVTLDGTTRKVLNAVKRIKQREEEKGHKKYLIVVSSQESELIGADHVMSLARKHPDTIYFSSHAFEQDEWKSRDVALHWLYQIYNEREGKQVTERPVRSRAVNIIGPTYACFNSYADLHELERLIRGAGGELHYSFPFGAKYDEMYKLDESSVNVVMYREFGETLAQELGKPYLFAPFGMQETTDFVLELGKLLGTTAEAKAFVQKEKRETLRPVWDIWLGAPQDFYNSTKIAIISNESYALGLKRFLADELGMQICLVVNRQKSNDTNNYILRNRLAAERPTFVMGSLNERIYMAEAGLTAKFIPAALPVPLITRSVGTPYMGYRGAVYLMQIITNALFDILFDILPREKRNAMGLPGGPKGERQGSPMQHGSGKSPAQPTAKPSAGLDELSGIKWDNEAKAIFDQMIEKVPWIARISASDKLRVAAITEARADDVAVVSVQHVMRALPKIMQ